MIIWLIIAIMATSFVFYLTRPSKLKQKLKALSPTINKKLSLEESYAFLDLVREITLELVERSQKQHNLKEITTKLLGFVLTVPRINEKTDNSDPLAQAVYQIGVVLQTTQETQDYLKKHFPKIMKMIQ